MFSVLARILVAAGMEFVTSLARMMAEGIQSQVARRWRSRTAASQMKNCHRKRRRTTRRTVFITAVVIEAEGAASKVLEINLWDGEQSPYCERPPRREKQSTATVHTVHKWTLSVRGGIACAALLAVGLQLPDLDVMALDQAARKWRKRLSAQSAYETEDLVQEAALELIQEQVLIQSGLSREHLPTPLTAEQVVKRITRRQNARIRAKARYQALDVSNPEPEKLADPNVETEEGDNGTYPLLARLKELPAGELSGLLVYLTQLELDGLDPADLAIRCDFPTAVVAKVEERQSRLNLQAAEQAEEVTKELQSTRRAYTRAMCKLE